ncbi:MAG: bifunctional nuclease domain-containing protein [Bacteroidia bacterium]
MEKIKLNIIGLSYSQTQTGAYALVLGEEEGSRRIPIIIGGFEAQAIAIELEDMKPSRPLTHDLFKSVFDSIEAIVEEVIIYNLVEGVFFSKLICKHNGKEFEIDSRTSDAIAIAVRFECPIYTYESIISSAGIILENEEELSEKEGNEEDFEEEIEPKKKKKESLKDLTIKELKDLLKEAIANEDYERASKLRDEIEKRKSS